MPDDNKPDNNNTPEKLNPEAEEEIDESLPFPNARVVAVMKKYLSKDKMIRTEVKKAMNRFLEEIVADICKRMDEQPYAMIDYWMFEKAIEPYKRLDKLDAEKERVIDHLEAIEKDIEIMKKDIMER